MHLTQSKSLNNQGGFIALISSIIIALVLVTITFTLGFSGWFSRFTVLYAEYKEVSIGLAEACAETAILEIAKGNTPAANTIVSVSSNQCMIVSVVGSPQRAVKTVANYKNSYTNLKILVTRNAGNVTIDSWEECPNACP